MKCYFIFISFGLRLIGCAEWAAPLLIREESPEEVETGNNEGNHTEDTHPLVEHPADVSVDKDTDNGDDHEPESREDGVTIIILNEEEVKRNSENSSNTDKEAEENHTESLASVGVNLTGDAGGSGKDGKEENASEEGVMEELMPALGGSNGSVMLIDEVSNESCDEDSREEENTAEVIFENREIKHRHIAGGRSRFNTRITSSGKSSSTWRRFAARHILNLCRSF